MNKEVVEKVERINLLEQYGFNTPRFFLVRPNEIHQIKDKLLQFIDGASVVNIRTYDRHGKDEEGYNRPHVTNLNYTEVIKKVEELNYQYVCMVDLEHPNDGLYAGCVLVRDEDCIVVDYCTRENGVGAVVRNANKSITIPYDDNGRLSFRGLGLIPDEIRLIIQAAMKFPKKPTILEWSYQSTLAGKKQDNIIWWEFRRYR